MTTTSSLISPWVAIVSGEDTAAGGDALFTRDGLCCANPARGTHKSSVAPTRCPVFAHVVLVDELNRTPPRTQSALLETMEEQQVTVDGQTWPLPRPHLVIATQNPRSQRGTFPLVESQLDRFAIATSIGYPDADHVSRDDLVNVATRPRQPGPEAHETASR